MVLCAELAVPGNVVGVVAHMGVLVGPGVSLHKGFTYVSDYFPVGWHKNLLLLGSILTECPLLGLS